jgi:hypothetical protein
MLTKNAMHQSGAWRFAVEKRIIKNKRIVSEKSTGAT